MSGLGRLPSFSKGSLSSWAEMAPHLGGGWGLSIGCNGFQLNFLLLGLLHCWLLHHLLFLLWAGSPGRSAGEKNKGMFTGVIGDHPVVCWGPVRADSLGLHPSSFTQGTCHVRLSHKCYWVRPRIQAPGHTLPCLALGWPAPVHLNQRKVLDLIHDWLLENSVQYPAYDSLV